MAGSLRDRDLGLRRVLAQIKRMGPKEVAVGIQSGPMNDGVSVAEYAGFNEFGTSRIPSRPFMRTSFDNYQQRMIQLIADQENQMITGTVTYSQLLNRVGLTMQSAIKSTITSGSWVPNTAYTISMKGGGKPPLIDSSTMLKSVTYAIRGFGETQR